MDDTHGSRTASRLPAGAQAPVEGSDPLSVPCRDCRADRGEACCPQALGETHANRLSDAAKNDRAFERMFTKPYPNSGFIGGLWDQ